MLERFAPQSPQHAAVVRTKRNGNLRHRNPTDIFDAAPRIYYFDVKCRLINFAPIAMVHTMGADLHSRRDQVCEGLSIEEMRHPYSGGDNEECCPELPLSKLGQRNRRITFVAIIEGNGNGQARYRSGCYNGLK